METVAPRSPVLPHFEDAMPDRSHVTKVSVGGSVESPDQANPRGAVLQPIEPGSKAPRTLDREHLANVIGRLQGVNS
jgi:hypothetical protein